MIYYFSLPPISHILLPTYVSVGLITKCSSFDLFYENAKNFQKYSKNQKFVGQYFRYYNFGLPY